jgi:two-component system response regulator DevR
MIELHPHARQTDGRHRPRSIVLIEDHVMVATALGGVLSGEPDLVLRGTAGTIDAGLELVRRARPDVIVADHRLPDGEITDHVRRLLAAAPLSRVLVMAGLPTEQALLTAMDAGASGFICKSQPMDEFLDAVRRVGHGETVVAPSLLPCLVRRLGGATDRGALTARELEILHHLAAGRGTSQIAAALALSPNTVRNHVAHLTAKLGAHSRLEAVSIGIRRGLIAPAAS